MSFTGFEKEQALYCDVDFFKKQTHKNYKNTLLQFKKIFFANSLFKIGFFLLFVVELLFFCAFIGTYAQNSYLAITLGAMFLTVFTYCVMLFYFQAKKPEQMLVIKDSYIESCRRALSMPRKTAEHHLSIAHAAIRFSSQLAHFEERYFSFSGIFRIVSFLFKKLSYILHKNDVFKMRELLLYAAIEEHFEQIRSTPTDLEVHASLANAYVVLSRLYLEKKSALQQAGRKEKHLHLEEKFHVAAQKALEELKILNDYAPNDPWVHAQLAQSYRELNMKKEESKEYEAILELNPNDLEVLFRLGVTYFELGENASGLCVYEKLKVQGFHKVEDLLQFYSSIHALEYLDDSF